MHKLADAGIEFAVVTCPNRHQRLMDQLSGSRCLVLQCSGDGSQPYLDLVFYTVLHLKSDWPQVMASVSGPATVPNHLRSPGPFLRLSCRRPQSSSAWRGPSRDRYPPVRPMGIRRHFDGKMRSTHPNQRNPGLNRGRWRIYYAAIIPWRHWASMKRKASANWGG